MITEVPEHLQRPRRNRVTPFGEFQAVADKGTMLGNRGDLHDSGGKLGKRRWATKAWICCTLDERRGRKISFDRKGTYYPLFFVDEATAMAAGHRPCGECRNAALKDFKEKWARAKGLPPGTFIRVAEIDAELHRARLGRAGDSKDRQFRFGDLPDGAMFYLEDSSETARLAWQGSCLIWSPSGYGVAETIEPEKPVFAITPKPLIEVLRAGYKVLVHPDACHRRLTGRCGAPG